MISFSQTNGRIRIWNLFFSFKPRRLGMETTTLGGCFMFVLVGWVPYPAAGVGSCHQNIRHCQTVRKVWQVSFLVLFPTDCVSGTWGLCLLRSECVIIQNGEKAHRKKELVTLDKPSQKECQKGSFGRLRLHNTSWILFGFAIRENVFVFLSYLFN